MTKVMIPTIIFRDPIHTNQGYEIQGMLLAFGKYRESPFLSDWETSRLKQLASTEEWIATGGEIEGGVWVKDGQCRSPKSFIEANYKGHLVSLVPVEYDRYAAGCLGVWADILAEPNTGQIIRDWVDKNGTWHDIEYLLSEKVDVQNDISGIPNIEIPSDTSEKSNK